MRVVTFAFRAGDYRLEMQDEIMKGSIPVLEQPVRMMRVTKNTKRKNSLWVQIDQSKYKYQKSYITEKVNNKGKRWLTAGQLYKTHTCVKTCPECENQCMVRELTGYGHMLGEENMKGKTGVIV